MQFVSDKGRSYIVQKFENNRHDQNLCENKLVQDHYQYQNYNTLQRLNEKNSYECNKINCKNVTFTDLDKNETITDKALASTNFTNPLKTCEEENSKVYQNHSISSRCQPPCCTGQCMKLSVINNYPKNLMVSSALNRHPTYYNTYGSQKIVSEILSEDSNFLTKENEEETIA